LMQQHACHLRDCCLIVLNTPGAAPLSTAMRMQAATHRSALRQPSAPIRQHKMD
jgi:hypothetical protein